jgi:hypothetical protein
LASNDGADATVYLSARSGAVSASFDTTTLHVKNGETKGTYLRFEAAGCSRGEENVVVTGEFCVNGACQTRQTTVKVTMIPCASLKCTSVDDNSLYFKSVSGVSCTGEGCSVVNRNTKIEFSNYFDPSEVSLRINGPAECQQAQVGELTRVVLQLINSGAPAQFNLQSIDRGLAIMNPSLSQDSVAMSRNSVERVLLDVIPSKSVGRYWVTVQATKDGFKVASKDVCFDVSEKSEALLTVPQKVSGDSCSSITFRAKLENTGSTTEKYVISSNVASVPDSITLGGGEVKYFDVVVPKNRVSTGSMEVSVKAESEHLIGSTVTTVKVSECSGVSFTQTREGDNIRVTALVNNDRSDAMQRVSLALSGLPSSWLVVGREEKDIPAHSSESVSILVKPGTSEEVTVVAKVLEDGSEVKSAPLTLSGNAGLTGFFILGGSNWLLLLLLLIIALALLLFLFGKRSSTSTATTAIVERPDWELERLKAVQKSTKEESIAAA